MPRQPKIPRVNFNLKHSQDQSKETMINVLFHYRGQRLKFSTREKILPTYWDKKRQRASYTKKHPEYSEINERLNELENIVIKVFKASEFGKIDVTEFKRRIKIELGEIEQQDSFIPFMNFVEQLLEERGSKVNAKKSTEKKLYTIFNHLKEYSKETKKQLTYDDFTFEFKSKFENWLYQSPREHSTNYAAKVFTIIRQFLHEATRRGYNTNMTFMQKGWSIKKEKTQNVILSFDELDKLYQLDLSNNKRLDKVRDLFLIGAFSGLRFSDFTRIRPKHIYEEEGVEMIKIWTVKTDTEVVIPLMPLLKTVLEKYEYRSPKSISNQKMNIYLKELCQLAGINEEVNYKYSRAGTIIETKKEKWELITTHTARRSFATNFYELGFPAIELMQITGHTTEGQFMTYININKKRNAISMAKRFKAIMNQKNEQ